MLSALLISDIHFRREKRVGGSDRDIELRNGLLQFLPELRERLSRSGGEFQTGAIWGVSHRR